MEIVRRSYIPFSLTVSISLDSKSKNFSTSSVPLVCISVIELNQYSGEDTPTGVRLEQLIEMYLPLIEHPSSTHEPISVIVITNGACLVTNSL